MTKYILAVAVLLITTSISLVAQPKSTKPGKTKVRPELQRLPPKSLDEVKQQVQQQRGQQELGQQELGQQELLGPANLPEDPGPVPLEGLGYLLAAGALWGAKKVRDVTTKK